MSAKDGLASSPSTGTALQIFACGGCFPYDAYASLPRQVHSATSIGRTNHGPRKDVASIISSS